MTNEELVELVQSGNRDALLPLWEQVQRLMLKQANKWARIGRLELEDFEQVGFIALMEAVRTYDGSAAFSTWLVLYIKREFTAACSQRTEKQRQEPILNAVSLDQPIADGADGDPLLLSDILEDPTAEAAMEAVEDRDYHDRLHAALMDAIAELPECQQEAVRGRYWRGGILTLWRRGRG